MGVPDYETLMRPTLDALADGSERTFREVQDLVAAAQGVTDEDRELLLPSGKQSVFSNRVGWAITYMVKAGLVRRPRRAVVTITARGKQLLEDHAGRIDGAILDQFPEFVEFKTTRHVRATRSSGDNRVVGSPPGSPTESIAALVDDVNSAVAAEVLERVLEQPPVFLERLVLVLLEAMGYGGIEALSEHLGGPGDEGLDGVIRQDALGLDVVYVQAKRYAPERKIGRPDIQAFVGALNGARADRGIFITTSAFTADARAYVDRVQNRLVLIDGQRLAAEMVRRNVGVQVREVHEVKRIDEDFFSE
jgi:restriction system protein